MANRQIPFFLFSFFIALTYLHIVDSYIRIRIYKRKPVSIIVQIKNSLNNISKICVSKEYPNK